MPTRVYCDNPVCNKEFSNDELFGNFSYLTATYTKQMQKQVAKNELIFCENCAKDLLKMMDDKIESFNLAKKKKE